MTSGQSLNLSEVCFSHLVKKFLLVVASRIA